MTQYELFWDSGLGTEIYTSLVVITNTAQTQYTKSGLTQGTTYKFKILARNIYGDGPTSAAIEIIPSSPPEAPINLALISSDQTQITFQWTAPASGGYPITSYKVYWDNNTNGATFTAATPSSVGSATT